MKRILFFAAAAAFAPCLASARAATLDGTWHIKGSVQENPVNPVCVLAEKDGKLTGTCLGTDGKPVPIAGTVKDKSIKWQYDTFYQGSAITIFFTGAMDKEDHLTGGIYVEPYAVDGGFTATRDNTTGEKPASPPPAS